MQIIINPGSGPVADATVEHADTNIAHFVLDLALDDIKVLRNTADDERGRFGYLLWCRDDEHRICACTVQMPGIPLSHVRFMQEPGQDVWDFPRLYVEDSSWLWCFALDNARDALTREGGGEAIT